jgi:hypothetical protein
VFRSFGGYDNYAVFTENSGAARLSASAAETDNAGGDQAALMADSVTSSIFVGGSRLQGTIDGFPNALTCVASYDTTGAPIDFC